MVKIIEELAAKFKESMYEVWDSDNTMTIDELEVRYTTFTQETLCLFIGKYLEQKDRELLEDKEYRRENQLVVQRRDDPRLLYTLLGEILYHRTYYYKKAVGYEHPIDIEAGVEAYSRMSQFTSYALVDAACSMSYAMSSKYVTDGAFSKQTVMRKIRESYARESPELPEKARVPCLHIDADEDHVSIRDKGSRIVPVISVYEGLESVGKTRKKCKNVFHISEYGKSTEDLWNQVVDELDKRYDLRNTEIYLHGDGAPWIAEGLNWLPNAKFVLDTYHKNKMLKVAVSGFTEEDKKIWVSELQNAFATGNKEFVKEAWSSMLSSYPDRKETIDKGMGYLTNFFDGIYIRAIDQEANNGGATEPHVQHVLSYRLSSIPRVWSEETIKHLAPILAAKNHTFIRPVEKEEIPILSARDVIAKPRKQVKNGIGLPDPDIMASSPAMFYKNNPIKTILSSFSRM